MRPLILRETSSEFELPAEGHYLGNVDAIVLLGRQDTNYGERRQVHIRVRLAGTSRSYKDKAGQRHTVPMTIGRTYTLSLHRSSALLVVVEALLGRGLNEDERRGGGFDLWGIAGLPGSFDVRHSQGNNGRTYANIDIISPAPAGTPLLPIGECLLYDPDQSSGEELAKLSKWMQEAIRKRLPEPESTDGTAVPFDDDVPF